jgi:hypothetical protein
MSNKIDQTLAQFNSGDVSVRLCEGLFSVMPFAPKFAFYNNFEGAAGRVGGDVASARQLAGSEDVGKAVWVGEALDTSDKLIAGFAGVKNLFSIFGGSGGGAPRKRTFEADQEQAADAALKGVGIAYMIYKLFPGDVAQKVKLFRETPAGQEIALFYVTADIALPFADNLVESGTGAIKKLFDSQNAGIASKFSQFAGADAFSQASGVLGQLTGTFEEYASKAKEYSGPVMSKLQSLLPSGASLLNAADSATGVAASGIDLLPVYTFLSARLAAEACALRAARGL